MKILFQSRIDLYDPKGGDTSQMEHTKSAIEKIDPSIKIDIRPEIKITDIDNYDLVHLFNLDWVCETYLQAVWARQHNKPIVLSAIHHSAQEVREYEDLYRFDIRRLYNWAVSSQPLRDEWKNIYRSATNYGKAFPSLVQILAGIRYQQREIIKMSDIVLVQTDKEAEDIKLDFNVPEFPWAKIVNGVDLEIFSRSDNKEFLKLMMDEFGEDFTDTPIILNVGRVEPRKNQLNLIKAFESLKKRNELENYKLVFIGDMTKRSPEYKYRFKIKDRFSPNIYYLGQRSQNIVASAMSHQGIYVHPSWFETTGLVALEAAVAGMRVVASGDRIKEYLGNNAYYCSPWDVEELQRAIINASESKPLSSEYKAEIASKYGWEQTASQTIEVYRRLLTIK